MGNDQQSQKNMTKRQHPTNKLPDASSGGDEEDIENSSILGHACSSAFAMSDWGSYAQSAGGADSTTSGLVAPRTRRMIAGRADILENSVAADVDEEEAIDSENIPMVVRCRLASEPIGIVVAEPALAQFERYIGWDR